MDLNKITLTGFEQKNEILVNQDLQKEMGYSRFSDGSYLVSMTCPMPNITPEMIQWWFWWHPQKDERYQMWFPGEHFAISYAKKDKNYFEKEMLENQIPVIVCGHVGAYKGLIWHTEMAHIFKQTEDGLMLISRFWIGEKLKNPFLRKLILIDETAKGMAEHCYVEYRNLVKILPDLYLKRSSR